MSWILYDCVLGMSPDDLECACFTYPQQNNKNFCRELIHLGGCNLRNTSEQVVMAGIRLGTG